MTESKIAKADRERWKALIGRAEDVRRDQAGPPRDGPGSRRRRDLGPADDDPGGPKGRADRAGLSCRRSTRSRRDVAEPSQALAIDGEAAGPGELAEPARQPAVDPGDRQPGLAVPLRPGDRRRPRTTSAWSATSPSHPELLDWLARRFVAEGWRLKPLHRLILTSAAYRQSAARSESEVESARLIDPEDRLLWKWTVQRLEAEEIRDAMLAVSGELDAAASGPSVDPKIAPPVGRLQGEAEHPRPGPRSLRRPRRLHQRRPPQRDHDADAGASADQRPLDARPGEGDGRTARPPDRPGRRRPRPGPDRLGLPTGLRPRARVRRTGRRPGLPAAIRAAGRPRPPIRPSSTIATCF